MDVMGDKATLLDTGRFVQPADYAQSAGDSVQPMEDASQPMSDLVQPEDTPALDRPLDADDAGRPPRRHATGSPRRAAKSRP